MSQVVVVIGGGPLSPFVVSEVDDDATIIAADSGLDHAVAAGLRPTVLIGDLDSISAHGKMWAYAHEVEIDEYPADKDAHRHRAGASPRRLASTPRDLLVLGATGDRFDHTLGTLGRARPPGARRVRNDPAAPRRASPSTSSTPGTRSPSTLPLAGPLLAARPARAVPRCHRHRRTLATDRRLARSVEHSRPQQRDNRSAHTSPSPTAFSLWWCHEDDLGRRSPPLAALASLAFLRF